MISTARHVEYALGYLALGLTKEASEELDTVEPADRFSPRVMEVRLALHTAEADWSAVAILARRLIELDRNDVGAWISLGCAVRRTDNVAAARAILLEVEATLGVEHAVVHYNLACYHCLLGGIEQAKKSLATACAMEAGYKRAALADPDLERLWAYLAATG